MSLRNYWKGEKSLAKSFWLIYVIGSLVTLAAYCFVGMAAALAFSVSIYSAILIALVVFGLFNPYYFFSWISVWRCSKNSDLSVLAFGAKGLVVIHMIFYLYYLSIIPEYIAVMQNEF